MIYFGGSALFLLIVLKMFFNSVFFSFLEVCGGASALEFLFDIICNGRSYFQAHLNLVV